jgi:myo-inositol-1(or 4)-monophosphatase
VLLNWAGRFAVREKGPADLVTEADLAAQQVIQDKLLSAFPRHGFLGEEDADIPSRENDLRWIVDPIDGTTNYVHAAPGYCVSIALVQAGEPIVGVVFDPVAQQCFTAARGEGAFLNGRRLQVSSVRRASDALVAGSFSARVDRSSRELAEFVEMVTATQSVRRMGSAALNLCSVAAGWFDGYWSSSTKAWDVAAGWLLVTEAGGLVTHLDGSPRRFDGPRHHAHFLAAANAELHAELLAVLRRAHPCLEARPAGPA